MPNPTKHKIIEKIINSINQSFIVVVVIVLLEDMWWAVISYRAIFRLYFYRPVNLISFQPKLLVSMGNDGELLDTISLLHSQMMLDWPMKSILRRHQFVDMKVDVVCHNLLDRLYPKNYQPQIYTLNYIQLQVNWKLNLTQRPKFIGFPSTITFAE